MTSEHSKEKRKLYPLQIREVGTKRYRLCRYRGNNYLEYFVRYGQQDKKGPVWSNNIDESKIFDDIGDVSTFRLGLIQWGHGVMPVNNIAINKV